MGRYYKTTITQVSDLDWRPVGQDHVGTNLSPSAHLYLGEEGEDRYSHMSQCVGVGAWLTTTDNMIVLVENAAWKGEQACRFVIV